MRINIFALLFKVNFIECYGIYLLNYYRWFFFLIFFCYFFIFPKINNYPPGQYQICADIYSPIRTLLMSKKQKTRYIKTPSVTVLEQPGRSYAILCITAIRIPWRKPMSALPTISLINEDFREECRSAHAGIPLSNFRYVTSPPDRCCVRKSADAEYR